MRPHESYSVKSMLKIRDKQWNDGRGLIIGYIFSTDREGNFRKYDTSLTGSQGTVSNIHL